MTKPFIREWIELIRPLFPSDARIESDCEWNDAVLRIDWKLGTDPDRPNKRSRLIRIVILEEAIEDCQDFHTGGQEFQNMIENRISTFNPDHANSRDVGPPVEEWRISSFDLN